MKLKTTKKAIRESNSVILNIGYCDLQHLLNYKQAFAYSSGVYGWSCDYYDIKGVIISTGYGPIGVEPDYNLIKAYNETANILLSDYNMNYETKKAKLDTLLNAFITKAVESIK